MQTAVHYSLTQWISSAVMIPQLHYLLSCMIQLQSSKRPGLHSHKTLLKARRFYHTRLFRNCDIVILQNPRTSNSSLPQCFHLHQTWKMWNFQDFPIEIQYPSYTSSLTVNHWSWLGTASPGSPMYNLRAQRPICLYISLYVPPLVLHQLYNYMDARSSVLGKHRQSLMLVKWTGKSLQQLWSQARKRQKHLGSLLDTGQVNFLLHHSPIDMGSCSLSSLHY